MLSTTPLSFDDPYPGKHCEYPHKNLIFPETGVIELHFIADSMGLSSFKFSWLASKDVRYVLCNRVRNDGSGSSKVVDFGTNQKGVCDFLLVINSNLSSTLHRFWDTTTCWQNCDYPNTHLTPSLGENPFKFLDELFSAKTRDHGLSEGEDFVILASVILTQCQRVTVRRTERQTTRSQVIQGSA